MRIPQAAAGGDVLAPGTDPPSPHCSCIRSAHHGAAAPIPGHPKCPQVKPPLDTGLAANWGLIFSGVRLQDIRFNEMQLPHFSRSCRGKGFVPLARGGTGSRYDTVSISQGTSIFLSIM